MGLICGLTKNHRRLTADLCRTSALHWFLIIACLVSHSLANLCGNNVCDATETCLACPGDCSCNVGAWRVLESICDPRASSSFSFDRSSDCVTDYGTINSPTFGDFLSSNETASLELTAFIQPNASGSLDLRLLGGNIAAHATIQPANCLPACSARTVIHVPSQLPTLDVSGSFEVTAGVVYRVTVLAVSLRFSWQTTTHPRSLRVEHRHPEGSGFHIMNDVFFSSRICGDGICDAVCDTKEGTRPDSSDCSQSICGDGICDLYESPNSCFVDCWPKLAEECSLQTGTMSSQGGTLLNSTDTLGHLINTHHLWHLPGIDHLMHGFDIVSGEEKPSPIFYFRYCGGGDDRRVTDTETGSVYLLPHEVDANVIGSCSFEANVKEFSSASEIAEEKSIAYGVSASLSADFGSFGSASASFSYDKTARTASSLASGKSGVLSVATTTCRAYGASLKTDRLRWHPRFLSSLADATTEDSFRAIVERYGTHYYATTELGGLIEQVYSMDGSSISQSSESETQTSISAGFGFSVLGGNAGGKVSGSYDSTLNSESKSDVVNNAEKSSLRINGGRAGTFGPPNDQLHPTKTPWNKWAQSVPLNPAPVNYKLKRLYDLIPPTWATSLGNVRALWLAVENEIYQGGGVPSTTLPSVTLTMDFSAEKATIPGVWGDPSKRVVYLTVGDVTRPMMVAPSGGAMAHTHPVDFPYVTLNDYPYGHSYAAAPYDFSYIEHFKNFQLSSNTFRVESFSIPQEPWVDGTIPDPADDRLSALGIARVRVYDWSRALVLEAPTGPFASSLSTVTTNFSPKTQQCASIEIDFWFSVQQFNSSYIISVVFSEKGAVSFDFNGIEMQPLNNYYIPREGEWEPIPTPPRWGETTACSDTKSVSPLPLASNHRIKIKRRVDVAGQPIGLLVRPASIPRQVPTQLTLSNIVVVDYAAPSTAGVMYRMGVSTITVTTAATPTYRLFQATAPYQ